MCTEEGLSLRTAELFVLLVRKQNIVQVELWICRSCVGLKTSSLDATCLGVYRMTL